jgi:pimeloyl-ACP methyl ester carboxylesterase
MSTLQPDTNRPRVVPTHPALMALMSHVPVQAFVGPQGTLVHMFTGGDGAPVLAVHGSGQEGASWRGLLPWLGDDFRLHCPDLYGYGKSEAPPMPQRMSLDDNAALISALLRRFDRPVHLLGHAFGGAVALRAALELPGRVASMTLYEPLALHLLKPEYGGHAPAQRQVETLAADMRAACLRGEPVEAARLFHDHCSGAGSFNALTDARRAALATQAPRLCLDIAMAFGAHQPLMSYAGLRMPVLLLSGTRSSGSLRLIAERLAHALPAVRHAILPGFGHLAPLSQPDTVGRVIQPFLAACERAALQRAA